MRIEILLAIGGFLITVLAFVFNALDGMSKKIKEGMERETQQNVNIASNNHELQLLQTKLDGRFERLELINNGLLERINHNRSRLDSRLSEIEKFLDKTTEYTPRNRPEG